MLSVGQLNNMRRIHETLMPDTATILRRTLTDDSRGGQTASWSSIGETCACRLAFYANRPTMPDTINGGRIDQNERYLLTVPVGIVLSVADRVTVRGVTYELISPTDDGIDDFESSGGRSYQTAIRLLVKRV